MAETLDRDTRVRLVPRITANELARYMVSSDTAKIGIIRRARESTTPPRARYSEIRSALRTGLCDPVNERRILAAAKTKLEQKADDPASSSYARDDASKSLDVLECFTDMRNQLAGFDYQKAPNRQSPLIIHGVSVSVNCDILIHSENRGSQEIGAVLFRFTKPDEEESLGAASKRRDMGAYAATLVHMHLTAIDTGDRTPSYKLCWSADIQGKEVHAAPKTYSQKAQNIANACRFIAAIWDDA
jgi:hypothetical protein